MSIKATCTVELLFLKGQKVNTIPLVDKFDNKYPLCYTMGYEKTNTILQN